MFDYPTVITISIGSSTKYVGCSHFPDIRNIWLDKNVGGDATPYGLFLDLEASSFYQKTIWLDLVRENWDFL